VVAAPIWYWLHLKIGKRKAWLLWSLVQAVTNLGFFGVYKGDVMTCIAVSALNGVPMGAKFLADSVLADVIDYDEFLTGARSEATYMMFKSFLPKVRRKNREQRQKTMCSIQRCVDVWHVLF
jgi:Na+/melibiose symporter-like transporter